MHSYRDAAATINRNTGHIAPDAWRHGSPLPLHPTQLHPTQLHPTPPLALTDLLRVARAHRAANELGKAAVESRLSPLEPCPHSRPRARLLSTHTESARRSLSGGDTASLPLVAVTGARRALEGVHPNLVDDYYNKHEQKTKQKTTHERW